MQRLLGLRRPAPADPRELDNLRDETDEVVRRIIAIAAARCLQLGLEVNAAGVCTQPSDGVAFFNWLIHALEEEEPKSMWSAARGLEATISRCHACDVSVVQVHRLLELTVPIPDVAGPATLHDALKRYEERELLLDYVCPNRACKAPLHRAVATRRAVIVAWPQLVFLQLQRRSGLQRAFRFDRRLVSVLGHVRLPWQVPAEVRREVATSAAPLLPAGEVPIDAKTVAALQNFNAYHPSLPQTGHFCCAWNVASTFNRMGFGDDSNVACRQPTMSDHDGLGRDTVLCAVRLAQHAMGRMQSVLEALLHAWHAGVGQGAHRLVRGGETQRLPELGSARATVAASRRRELERLRRLAAEESGVDLLLLEPGKLRRAVASAGADGATGHSGAGAGAGGTASTGAGASAAAAASDALSPGRLDAVETALRKWWQNQEKELEEVQPSTAAAVASSGAASGGAGGAGDGGGGGEGGGEGGGAGAQPDGAGAGAGGAGDAATPYPFISRLLLAASLVKEKGGEEGKERKGEASEGDGEGWEVAGRRRGRGRRARVPLSTARRGGGGGGSGGSGDKRGDLEAAGNRFATLRDDEEEEEEAEGNPPAVALVASAATRARSDSGAGAGVAAAGGTGARAPSRRGRGVGGRGDGGGGGGREARGGRGGGGGGGGEGGGAAGTGGASGQIRRRAASLGAHSTSSRGIGNQQGAGVQPARAGSVPLRDSALAGNAVTLRFPMHLPAGSAGAPQGLQPHDMSFSAAIPCGSATRWVALSASSVIGIAEAPDAARSAAEADRCCRPYGTHVLRLTPTTLLNMLAAPYCAAGIEPPSFDNMVVFSSTRAGRTLLLAVPRAVADLLERYAEQLQPSSADDDEGRGDAMRRELFEGMRELGMRVDENTQGLVSSILGDADACDAAAGVDSYSDAGSDGGGTRGTAGATDDDDAAPVTAVAFLVPRNSGHIALSSGVNVEHVLGHDIRACISPWTGDSRACPSRPRGDVEGA